MVFGGNGSLGKALVSSFKAKSWRVLSVDINHNSDADENLLISNDLKIQAQLPEIYQQAEKFSTEFDSILCVAGGFGVSSIKDNDVMERYAEMDKINF